MGLVALLNTEADMEVIGEAGNVERDARCVMRET